MRFCGCTEQKMPRHCNYKSSILSALHKQQQYLEDGDSWSQSNSSNEGGRNEELWQKNLR